MLTTYALVAIIVLCLTALGLTLMVRDSLCELSIKERSMEFKAVLAYETKKSPVCGELSPLIRRLGKEP